MNTTWPIGLGLTPESSNDEIKAAVFEYARQCGTMTFATLAADGLTPTVRAMEVHRLDELGNLYVGMSHGKGVYEEVLKNPRISAGTMQFTEGRLGFAVRINAELEEVTDPALFDRYWEQNPGTKALYRRDLTNFRLFVMKRGDGEVFDLCEDDRTVRFRFGFGGAPARPWRYEITEDCIGCGSCIDGCMKGVMTIENGRAVIDHSGCLECGRCYDACPVGAVKKA
ncbi:MAG: 4Fe-4S dicluster domain-containing protein [Clostridia bacterium]|nr:4Fe-4S dicluster domain-containing protein [Clostridia bacterium]